MGYAETCASKNSAHVAERPLLRERFRQLDLQQIATPEATEASLRRTLELAIVQGAKVFELRAATGLVRLWRRLRNLIQRAAIALGTASVALT